MSLPSDMIIYLSKIIILAILGPKIKVLGSTEVPGSSEINRKATSDIHSTNKVKSLKIRIMDLEMSLCTQNPDLSHFWARN